MFSRFLIRILHLLSLMPLRVLHRVVGGLFYAGYRLVGYRKKVVIQNLRNSFPELPESEIRNHTRAFYRHLADVASEYIYLMRPWRKGIRQMVSMPEDSVRLLNEFHAKKQAVILVMGHQGFWETIGPSLFFNAEMPAVPVYRTLKNKAFDQLFIEKRGYFSLDLITQSQVARRTTMMLKQEQVFALLLLADQSPKKEHITWIRFLNQDTAANQGPEKLARMLNLPVVFVSCKRVSRGKYRHTLEIITLDPGEMPDNAITEKYFELLEKEIRQNPAEYLWSHNRWKWGKGGRSL